MSEENKQTKEYIDPHDYIKEEDPEQFTITDEYRIERKKRFTRWMVLLSIILLLLILLSWATYEFLGLWIVKIRDSRHSPEAIRSAAAWMYTYLPPVLLIKGILKTENESVIADFVCPWDFDGFVNMEEPEEPEPVYVRFPEQLIQYIDRNRISGTGSPLLIVQDYYQVKNTFIPGLRRQLRRLKSENAKRVLISILYNSVQDKEDFLCSIFRSGDRFIKQESATFLLFGRKKNTIDEQSFSRAISRKDAPELSAYVPWERMLFEIKRNGRLYMPESWEKVHDFLFKRMEEIQKLGLHRKAKPDTVKEAVKHLFFRGYTDYDFSHRKNNDAVNRTFAKAVKLELGLYGDNYNLLQECRKILNIPEDQPIDPDDAALVILEALWKELTKDIDNQAVNTLK